MGNQKSQVLPPQNEPIWAWKSNFPPPTPDNPENWINYPEDISRLIEEAFTLYQPNIDLGEYLIDFGTLTQHKKADPNDKKSVKRIENGSATGSYVRKSKFSSGQVIPKSINDAFGNMQDFKKFIKQRSIIVQDILDDPLLHGKIKDKATIQRICKAIIVSITLEANSLSKKEVNQLDSLVNPFNDPSLQDYLEVCKLAINAYTQDTFLYGRVNTLLREEDWTKLTNLLPYAYFLCDAICRLAQYTPFDLRPCEKVYTVYEKKIFLYRGASLPDNVMLLYDPATTKYFSWNAFTSTTKVKEVASNFNVSKTGFSSVLFKIEVDIEKYGLLQQALDVYHYSKFSSEHEVIFGPGTVFELVRRQEKDKIFYIDLRAVWDLEKIATSLKGKAMVCLDQLPELLNKNKPVIALSGMTDKDIKQAISMLIGKQFVRRLNIKDSHFSSVGITEFMKALTTLQHIEYLAFYQTPFSVDTVKVVADYLPLTGIKGIYLNVDLNHITDLLFNEMTSGKAMDKIDYLELDGWHATSEQRMITSCIPLATYKVTQCKATKLTLVNFYGCLEFLEICHHFGGFLAKSSLEQLKLWLVDIDNAGIMQLVNYLPNTKIKYLGLYHTQITDAGLQALTAILPKTKIDSLDFHNEFITDYGMGYLSHSLTQLKRLDLKISFQLVKSIHFLAPSLKKSQITELILSPWSYDSDCNSLAPLFASLPLTQVENFIISYGVMDAENIIELIKVLPETKIINLYLGIKLPRKKFNDENEFFEKQKLVIQTVCQTLPTTKVKTFEAKLMPDSVLLKLLELTKVERFKNYSGMPQTLKYEDNIPD